MVVEKIKLLLVAFVQKQTNKKIFFLAIKLNSDKINLEIKTSVESVNLWVDFVYSFLF